MIVTLKDLVRQYGTNLLEAGLAEGTVIVVSLYGRVCRITVTEGGRSAEFSVDG